MLSLNTLRNTAGARRRKMRVGCGNGCGKGGTCGRGHKGQYARSGHKHKPGFEGGQMRLLRRIPKRGFNNARFADVFNEVSLAQLARFPDGAEITPESLRRAGLAKLSCGGRPLPIKVLGGGELKRKLTVKAHAFSTGAKEKIIAAGGACEVLA